MRIEKVGKLHILLNNIRFYSMNSPARPREQNRSHIQIMEILTEEHLIMDQAVLVMMTMTYSSFSLPEKYHSIYIECEEDLSEYIFIFYGFIQ